MNRLALRLALRQLSGHRASTILTAIAIAIPMTVLITANIVGGNNLPGQLDGTALDWGWITGVTQGAIAFGTPVAFIITVMIGAAFLVSARRNERMLALLESIGAPPSVLFRIVSAIGLLVGAISAGISLVVGILIGYLVLGPVQEHVGNVRIDVPAIAMIALGCVLLGWLAAILPAVLASSLDVTRVLRGVPKPVSGRWRTGRVGRIVMAIGLGMLLIVGVATPTLRMLYQRGFDPGFFGGLMLATPISALSQAGPLIVIAGVLLTMPAVFRTVGRLLSRFGAAPRLAARDAERNWGRSMPAAASIMVITFAIGSYLVSFGANAVLNTQTHDWQLQRNQVSVALIDTGYGTSDGILRPKPFPEPGAITTALESTLELTDSRVLGGVPGPFYGAPVDNSEGYSGRQAMAFPEGGLPQPEIAKDGPCAHPASKEVPPWRCTSPLGLESQHFELDAQTPTIWVGDAADLRLILGGSVDAGTRAAFARGDALVFDAHYLAGDGTTTISWHDGRFMPENKPGAFLPAGPPLRSETLPAHLVPLKHQLDYGVFLNEATAARLGLNTQPSRLLAQLSTAPDQAQQNAASDAVERVTTKIGKDKALWLPVEFELGPSEPDYAWSWGALLLAVGLTLAVSVTAIGLARMEGRETDATLAALGAGPGIRRRMSACYALIVVGFSTLSATALGTVPTYLGMLGWAATPPPLPFLELSLLAIGVPLAAASIAWLAAWRPARRG